jgi:Peptidase family M28
LHGLLEKERLDVMNTKTLLGWQTLVADYPWFAAEGLYPIPAYSEFMPPPRLGISPYGENDSLFSEDDPYGWHVSEMEATFELTPGLQNIAEQIMSHLLKLGRGLPGHHIGGHQGRNLDNNPYWPPELATHAGRLAHERYVILLPIALSRTQDDMGRVRWTFFGSSEQGPERAFWKSFYSAPGQELSAQESLSFILRLLASAYGEKISNATELAHIGFRILPSGKNARFPYWTEESLPTWTQPFLVGDQSLFDDVHYLLTFKPFSHLPTTVREQYLAGKLHLLPFPGSLAFWGSPTYQRLQEQMPFAFQLPLLRLAARQGGPDGIRVPQSGWLREPHRDQKESEIQEELLLNTYRRTNRMNRVHRHEDAVTKSTKVDKVAQVLFSTSLDTIELYEKPMARNAQLFSEEANLLLDGPKASSKEIERAAAAVTQGGLFRYRFQFPAMRVGLHEVYWHRPIVAHLAHGGDQVQLLPDMPLGYLTAYRTDMPHLSNPVELWPRLLRRDIYLSAVQNFESARDHYVHQTALNILALFDAWQHLGEQPLPRTFARQLLRVAKDESLDDWLNSLPERANPHEDGTRVQRAVQALLGSDPALPPAITYEATATRVYETAYWQDILTLAHGRYLNKDNADVVDDPVTLKLIKHRQRDLEQLGDYLIERHRQAIAANEMDGQAVVGDLLFRWQTDFDFTRFGGWQINQEGHARERNILVIIPGKNRREAVVLGDHYDTAYMEDIFDKSRGGSGARLASAGADDNHSATATLLQAAPIFLKLAREGKLERDVWLLHLTGEEFPADCLGARHFCQALVEKDLQVRLGVDQFKDLSGARVVGVFVMDMIAHNRDNAPDIFQISLGKSRAALRLAYQAHIANAIWNEHTQAWNQSEERRGRVRGKRGQDGITIPEIARHLPLEGQVRTSDDPQSSLYNTDCQIFSDIGAPVVLFMENYDINRTGYHDSKDTSENIDLDYGVALSAIAIETVARIATQAKI